VNNQLINPVELLNLPSNLLDPLVKVIIMVAKC